MMDIYTKDVQKIVHEAKAPYPGFIYDVVEFYDMPGFLGLQVYDENIADFSERQKQELSIFLANVRDEIKSLGIQCEIVGATYVPK